MRRPNSTLVVVAGDRAEEIVKGLDALPNVRAVRSRDHPPEALRDLLARASSTYLVHDADPLADVAAAWADFFDQAAPHGRLEVAVEDTIAALRTGRALLPDYYIVVEPETMPPTRRHWWLGVLAGTAPARVVPAPARVDAVRDALATLSTGRWWPDPPDQWLRGLGKIVPDHAGPIP
ncbi:hypothetical protein C3Y87_17010 [Carbonactinospora thermoautotrophica]|uniref:Uncharacterized protein n=1 Tax=Carbonactinospora thermoautotrophica TaxID=1469144 RepID=A0A132MTR7_9ACTN|nr:hypothetical protein [Carbonactinospora thermoautotrophica]KWX01229.1 hypothetical protein LI90_2257 [Carbonactinospora thermoautotrophica]KWX05568.1 hypothetical protein TH66_02590 [Carbonactinospora thermoautotrophica]KWX06788.1 hypothetical protein TR74_20925 [Carbonactinospora thermoautotrophica]MCX9193086.1 hypothetical protein [Carbonactinospora thermoautotrophica]